MSDRIDFDQVREIIRIAAESDLEELEVESPALKVRVKKGGPGSARNPVPAAAGEAAASPGEDHLEPLAAPMVGTFYRSAAPDASPFVREGDLVDEGQVVCIIEAMKLFNEIQAEKRGRIARVLVENASPVEYGQPLFLLDTTARA